MQIRPERVDDHAAVRDIHTSAFCDQGSVVADLVDDLRGLITPGNGVSLVAEDSGIVVGHSMLTPSLLDAPKMLVEVQVLSPLGVLPAHHGEGIGSALVRASLQMAVTQDLPLVFVEGDPNFYARFGFSAGGSLGFRKPSLRIPDGAFQALRFPSYEPWMTGTLVYAHVFWAHDSVGLRGESLAQAEAELEPEP